MILLRSWLRSTPACLLLSLIVSVLLAGTCRVAADQQLSARDFTGLHLGKDSGYGTAMASSGDWLAVGAPNNSLEMTGSYNGGRVLLWKREAGGWKLQQRLTMPLSNGVDSQFGRTLAMDGTRLLIGTSGRLGTAYVFSLQQNIWKLEGTLRAITGTPSNAGFGDSLALSGNLAIVASPTGPTGGSTSGWVDVYARETAGWVYKSRVTDLAAGSLVGTSVAMHGEMIIIGCPNTNIAGPPALGKAGKVAVFEKSGSTWNKTRDVFSPVPASGDAFGGKILVHEGRLYVFSPSPSAPKLDELSISGGFSQLNRLTLPFLDTQGIYCATDGTRLVLGSQSSSSLSIYRRGPEQNWVADSHQAASGVSDRHLCALWDGEQLLLGGSIMASGAILDWAVRTVRYSGAQWEFHSRIQPMDINRMDMADFGKSLSREGDWLFVGAPSTMGLRGFVYAYRKTTLGTFSFHSVLPDPVVPASSGLYLYFFGDQVASSGGRVAVGAASESYPTPAVIFYAWDAGTESWVQESIVSPLFGRPGRVYGAALALSTDFLAVGTPGESRVYLYSRSGSSWNPVTELAAPRAVFGEDFGRSLSLNGSRLLVGAPETGGGSAYLFELKDSVWTQAARLTPPPGSGASQFGLTVGLDGDRALVAGGFSTSPAHLYRRTATGWQHHMDLPSDSSGETRSAVLSGPVALVNTASSLSIFGLAQDKWVHLPPPLSQATSRSTGLLLSGQEVFFADANARVTLKDLSSAPLVTWSGDAEEHPGEAGTTYLEAGEYLVGAKIDRWLGFKVRNQGTLPVRVTATVSGDTADASFSVPGWDLGVVQEAEGWLRFQPKTVGEKTITLRFATSENDAHPAIYVIHVQVVAQSTVLQFVRVPASALVPSGELNHHLMSQVTGTRPWSFRWLKNGVFLPGATTADLSVDTAGSYQVEVTSPAGKIRSPAAAIGTYGVKAPVAYALPGQAGRCAVNVAGPGIQVRWTSQDPGIDVLQDTATFSGAQTATLTIRNARQEIAGGYKASITMTAQGSELEADVSITFAVVQPPSALLLGVDDGRLPLGQPSQMQCSYHFDGPVESDVFYTVTGLPPGLTTDVTGRVSGTPTKTGQYRVTITARIAQLTSAPLVRTLLVTESGLFTPGIYWGWIRQGPAFPLDGAVILDLRTDGSFTGSLQAGAKKTPLAGRLNPTNAFNSDRARIAFIFEGGVPHVGWIQQSQTENRLDFLVKPASGQESDIQPLSELNMIRSHASPAEPTSLVGRHSFVLVGSGDGGAGLPGGHGFGSVTLTADGRGTFSGQLADGGSITGAGWLTGAGTSPGGQPPLFYFYTTDKSGKASVLGSVEIRSEGAGEGLVTWAKLPVPGRLYPAGFEDVTLTWYSSRYQPGAVVQVFGGSVSAFLEVHPALGEVIGIPFQFSRQLKATFGVGGEANPSQARLDVYAPTGYFSGQFTLRDPDLADESRTITRTVQYRGMLLPDIRAGHGFFLLPARPDPSATPPTTFATSPIHSGPVIIGQ
ncbi:MAG: hypothetical protein V4662_13540 [Verrucomicrobiota bacterium]